MRSRNKFISFLVLFFLAFGFASAQGPVFRVRLFDTDYSHYLQLMWNEDRAANQTLNFITGAGDRTFTLSGNLTVESASLINQDLTTDSLVVAFGKLAISSGEDTPATFTSTDNSATITVSDDDTTAYMHASGGYASFGATTGDLNTLNIIVAETTGFVGIGTNAPDAHLDVINSTINTTTPYYGVQLQHTKTAGATDNADDFYGIYNVASMNDTDSTIGDLYGAYIEADLALGTIGTGTEDVFGVYGFVDLNAGTAGDDAVNQMEIDQEAANTISGDAKVLNLVADFDGTVTGTAYMLYLAEATGVDYGIYQSGTAPIRFGGIVTSVGAYSNDIGGDTYVNCIINSDGELGYDSTPAPRPSEMWAYILSLEARIAQLESLVMGKVK